MQESIFSIHFLRKQYHIPVIQNRRSNPSQSLESLEILGHGKTCIADILLKYSWRIISALRKQDDIMRNVQYCPGL